MTQSDKADWDPGQYLKFSHQRLRPAIELLERVPIESPGIVVDLGCGTGQVTWLLADRWHSARVFGVDSSPEMLPGVQAETSIRFVQADLASWSPPGAIDVLYSNAALHWVKDHHELLPRLAGFVRPGGCLAVQMPLSWSQPSHRLMRETLVDGGPGGTPLGTDALREAVSRKGVEEAEVYHELLVGRTRFLDIWQTEYLHVLEGDDPVLEWVTGTGLRPVLAGLSEEERELFLDAYRQRLREAYPRRPDGLTLYPFRRLFIIAVV